MSWAGGLAGRGTPAISCGPGRLLEVHVLPSSASLYLLSRLLHSPRFFSHKHFQAPAVRGSVRCSLCAARGCGCRGHAVSWQTGARRSQGGGGGRAAGPRLAQVPVCPPPRPAPAPLLRSRPPTRAAWGDAQPRGSGQHPAVPVRPGSGQATLVQPNLTPVCASAPDGTWSLSSLPRAPAPHCPRRGQHPRRPGGPGWGRAWPSSKGLSAGEWHARSPLPSPALSRAAPGEVPELVFPDTREAGVSSAACCPFMFLSRGIPSSRSSVRFPLGRFCLIGDNRPPVADTGPSSATEAGNTRLRPVRVSWLFAFPVVRTRHAVTVRRPGPSAAPAPPPTPPWL